MTPTSNNTIRSVTNVLTFGGLALIALGLAYLFLTPKIYQASARVRVEKRGLSQGADSASGQAHFSEASSMLDEYKYLNSDAFLNQVVANLDLRDHWSQGTQMSTNDALAMLHMKAHVSIIPDTSLFEIQVTSEVRDEPAPIANEIARRYRDYRRSQSQDASRGKIKSLQEKWDEQNKKVIAAQEVVSKLAFEINMARATNTTRFYDPDSYEALTTKRIDLESDYVEKQKLLARLKTMGPDELGQVLPTIVTNALLNNLVAQQFQSQRDLTQLKLDHGAQSPEVKHAEITVDLLNKKVTDAAAGVMVAQEADLASLKEMIDEVGAQLKNAKTNIEESATEPPAYTEARKQLDDLNTQRDALKAEIDRDSIGAEFPLGLSAEIVDNAETPTEPASPDKRLARGVMGIGGIAGIGGLLLWAGVQMRRRVPGPGADPRLQLK